MIGRQERSTCDKLAARPAGLTELVVYPDAHCSSLALMDTLVKLLRERKGVR